MYFDQKSGRIQLSGRKPLGTTLMRRIREAMRWSESAPMVAKGDLRSSQSHKIEFNSNRIRRVSRRTKTFR